MGFRTLVLLANDSMHEWSKDPELGSLIERSAAALPADRKMGFGSSYGYVLETSHADTQRLAVIDSYHMDTLAIGHWSQGATNMTKARDLALLKQAAEKLGYKLVKA